MNSYFVPGNTSVFPLIALARGHLDTVFEVRVANDVAKGGDGVILKRNITFKPANAKRRRDPYSCPRETFATLFVTTKGYRLVALVFRFPSLTYPAVIS